jgi:uncharacterized DUF497 family protein
MEFEFDPEKSAANLAKHGIDFEAAQAIWDDDSSIAVPAKDGDDGEARSVVIGMIGDKLWSAIITWRGVVVRIISVRRSRDDERMLYVETNNQR